MFDQHFDDLALSEWQRRRQTFLDPRSGLTTSATQLLAQALRSAAQAKSEWDELAGGLMDLRPNEDLHQIEQLYRLVLKVGGKGREMVEEELLRYFLLTAADASIPFLLELCQVERAHDRYTKTRQRNAVKVLGAIAVAQRSLLADQALLGLLRHPQATVRQAAITYGGGRFRLSDEPTPDRWITGLRLLLREEASSPVRAAAAYLLWNLGQSLPFDARLAYACRVRFQGMPIPSRTILTPARATLADLQRAIQHAMGWDNDHLYAFFMDGGGWHSDCPFWAPGCEDGPFADQVQLGQLALEPGQHFLYLFDFGDGHRFDVDVLGMQVMEPGGIYPRVIERVGESFAQYGISE